MSAVRSLYRYIAIIILATISISVSAKIISPNISFQSSSSSFIVVPEMKWVFLPAESNGGCISNTDPCENTFCFGLEYTPGNTGTLTSYTTAFIVDCMNNGSPVLSNLSCVMDDNSSVTNFCSQYNLIRFQSSGFGTLAVTNGVPVIIHQVCFTLPPGSSTNILEEEVTGLTTSIDIPGGDPITEYPEYEANTAGHAYIVTSPSDNGPGSFRDLVSCVPGGSTIVFDTALNQTLTLTTGAISIEKDLTIQGPGMLNLTISGNNASVIFHVLSGNNLTLKEISLQNANASVNGGAIFAEGNVIFQNVLLENNYENGIPKSMTISSGSTIEVIESVNIKN